MEKGYQTVDSNNKESCVQTNSKDELKGGYTLEEDMAIINFMITGKKYLLASGIQVWKEAEKLKICPGRPYLSMKERYRKIIVKNLKYYNVEKSTAIKITQFMRASRKGKSLIRQKEM